jgi:hypothetical protein
MESAFQQSDGGYIERGDGRRAATGAILQGNRSDDRAWEMLLSLNYRENVLNGLGPFTETAHQEANITAIVDCSIEIRF